MWEKRNINWLSFLLQIQSFWHRQRHEPEDSWLLGLIKRTDRVYMVCLCRGRDRTDVGRFLWRMRSAICPFHSCPEWLIGSAPEHQVKWAEKVVKSSLMEGALPRTLKVGAVCTLLEKNPPRIPGL